LNPQQKKRLSQGIRVSISVVFLGVLFYLLRDKLPAVWEAVKTANKTYLFWAFTLFFIPAMALLAYRIQPIFKVQNIKLSFPYVLYLRYIGFFFNNFLPSAVGGDLMTAYLASKKTGKGVESFMAVFLDRLIGFFTIFVLAAAAFFLVQEELPIPHMKTVMLVIVSIMIALPFFLFSKRVARPFKVLVAWLPEKILEQIKAAYHAIHQYRGHPFKLLHVILISLGFQCLGIYINYLFAMSLGMDVTLIQCFIFMPIIYVFSMIPSLGGLGVREGAYVVLFSGYGGSEKAFALSLLFFSTMVMASIIGGACYLFTGRVAPEELEKMEKEDMRILEKEDMPS